MKTSGCTEKKICNNFRFLGLKLDEEKNKNTNSGKKAIISSEGSKISVLVIPTNEELAIARAVSKIVRRG